MKRNRWLIGAVLLGFVFFLAVFVKKPIGVSTQFSVASGMIHSLIDRDVIVEDASRETGYRSSNAYYDKDNGKLAKSIKNPLNYDFLFVLAIPLGAFLAKLLNDKVLTKKEKEKKVWEKKTDEKFNVRKFIRTYYKSFLTGAIILFGARFAGGCTSGHMMSGMMQGSISALIFTVSVFAVAIPISIITLRQNLHKGGEL